MKKIFYILLITSLGLTAMGNAVACIPSTFDLYTCGGATFADGYTATVTLSGDWEGHTFQGEDDINGDCKEKKADGFACTKSGNLITARIDDATVMTTFASSTDEAILPLTAANGSDPVYAAVHADIFIPGLCAEIDSVCDHDNDGGAVTPEQNCYDSGFGGGTSATGLWGTAEDSCGRAAAVTGEGIFAEGTPFSSNRPKPGKNNHKNWAMYVELSADCEDGTLWVPHEATQVCKSAALIKTAVADGGDWPDEFIDAGDVAFSPDSDCEASFICESSSTELVDCIPSG